MIFFKIIFQTVILLLCIYIFGNVLTVNFEDANFRYFLFYSEILLNYLILFLGVTRINNQIKNKQYLFLKLFSTTIIIIIFQIIFNYTYDYLAYNYFPKFDPYIESSNILNIDYNGPNLSSTFYNVYEPILNPIKFLSELRAYSIINNIAILVQMPISKALIIAFIITYLKNRK